MSCLVLCRICASPGTPPVRWSMEWNINSKMVFPHPSTSLNFDNVAPTSPKDQVNTAVCNDKGMMDCDTAGIVIGNNNQNFLGNQNLKQTVHINSGKTTGQIISRLFQKDADTQTPQNLNEGSNSSENSKLSELGKKNKNIQETRERIIIT